MIKQLLFLLFINSFTVYAQHNGSNYFWKFHTYESITDYLYQLESHYPQKVTVANIGYSVMKRKIPVIKISLNKYSDYDYGKVKPVILVDAGTHAREWMTNAVALYLIHQLVENNANMLQNVDWYIIPLLNPVGYEYSNNNHRQWRKNLAKGKYCNGVDLNRNFGFHWGEFIASRNECHINYPGRKPFSEPETRALRDFVLQNQKRIKLFVSLHTYGELITYPYGYADIEVSPEFEKTHQMLGNFVAQKINSVRGSHYQAGRLSAIMYNASGLSIDWMAAVAEIPLCFIMELNNKKVKFTPSSKEIIPTSQEVFEGFKIFHKYVELRW